MQNWIYRHRRIWLWAGLWPALALVFALRFLPYFPNVGGLLGQDYAFYLPNLLAGYYWLTNNGLFSIPWFSPAFCGGFPFFGDPNEPWFSLPQFLTVVVSPLTAVRITIVAFAAIGFPGSYVLLRRGFGLTVGAAVIGAAVFMFNGFYIARMVVGHLINHPFMLAPAIAACILIPQRDGETWRKSLVCTVLAGVGFSVMFEAGMVNLIVPVGYAMTLLILLHAWRSGPRLSPWLRLAGGGCLAMALSAAKLVATLSLLAQFPRAQYPIPGIADLASLLVATVRIVFFQPTLAIEHSLVNGSIPLERHEWEYGTTPIALVLILAGLVAGMRRYASTATPARSLAGWLFVVLLPLPMLLNYYQPGWNAFIKSLPLFHSSSVLLRWFAVYVLIAPVGAAIGFDAITAGFARLRPAAAAIAVAGVLGWVSAYDFGIVYVLPFRPAAIEAAYAKVAVAGVPRITTNYMVITPKGEPSFWPERNDTFTWGMSQIACYQPVLGYMLENFPQTSMRLGPALLGNGEHLNLINPACYNFPDANDCHPGDTFPVTARAQAEKYLSYQPFDFRLPLRERLALIVSALAWIASLLVLLGCLPRQQIWRVVQARLSRRHSAG